LKLTVADAGAGKPVWTARASETFPDTQKILNDLQKAVDDLMAKTLKSFPPASKAKQVRVGGSLAEIDPPQKSNRGFRELHEFTK